MAHSLAAGVYSRNHIWHANTGVMKGSKYNSEMGPRRTALRDIAAYVQEQCGPCRRQFVSAWHLDCKEQRRLNAELGVNKVNYSRPMRAREQPRKNGRFISSNDN